MPVTRSITPFLMAPIGQKVFEGSRLLRVFGANDQVRFLHMEASGIAPVVPTCKASR